jgi:hypothetical protein
MNDVIIEYMKQDTWGGHVEAPNGSMFPTCIGKDGSKPDERNVARLQLLETLNQHIYPPWTLQRISELLIQPRYKTMKKLVFALDKLLTLG